MGIKKLGFCSVVEAARAGDTAAFGEAKQLNGKRLFNTICRHAFSEYVKKRSLQLSERVSHNLSLPATISY